MARAEVQTLGLLNRWPIEMYEDIWRYNQILGTGVRKTSQCQNVPYIQSERELIAASLHDALQTTAEYLGYYPAPMWIEDEIVTIDSERNWNGQTLSTAFGHLIAFGRRATSLIEPDVSITYTDRDSDGINETAVITVNNVGSIAAGEIQVFVREIDGAPIAADELWQIDNLRVVKSGSTATITGPRALFVKPATIWAREYETNAPYERFAGSTSATGDFLAEVDVYRVYADATNAVELLLDAAQVGAANAVVPVTTDIRNAEMGDFAVYSANGQSAPLSRPRNVRVSYRAGYKLRPEGSMDKQLALAITRYANTLMPTSPRICDRTMERWNEDRRVDENIAARDAWTPPPFGVSVGGLHTWSVVAARRIVLKGRPTVRNA